MEIPGFFTFKRHFEWLFTNFQVPNLSFHCLEPTSFLTLLGIHFSGGRMQNSHVDIHDVYHVFNPMHMLRYLCTYVDLITSRIIKYVICMYISCWPTDPPTVSLDVPIKSIQKSDHPQTHCWNQHLTTLTTFTWRHHQQRTTFWANNDSR